jgi:hypothetical protein
MWEKTSKGIHSAKEEKQQTLLHFICVHQTQQSAQVDEAVSTSGAFIALQKNSILETNLQTFNCQGEKHQAQKRRKRVAHLPAMELEMPLAAKAHGSGRATKICDKQSQHQQQYWQPQQHQRQQICHRHSRIIVFPSTRPPPRPPKDFLLGTFFSYWK